MKHRITNGGKAVELFIYDAIGGWLGGITPQMVAESLKDAGKVETINLRINSPGGDVFDGVTIYNLLKRHPAKVQVDIDGLCGSIATIIAMAGDTVRMAGNGTFMIHDPAGGEWGSASDLRKRADMLDQARDNILDTYVAKTGGNRDRISQLMSDETWMRASDAYQEGFVDELTDELEMAACGDLSMFKKVPEHLKSGPKANAYRAKIAAMGKRLK